MAFIPAPVYLATHERNAQTPRKAQTKAARERNRRRRRASRRKREAYLHHAYFAEKRGATWRTRHDGIERHFAHVAGNLCKGRRHIGGEGVAAIRAAALRAVGAHRACITRTFAVLPASWQAARMKYGRPAILCILWRRNAAAAAHVRLIMAAFRAFAAGDAGGTPAHRAHLQHPYTHLPAKHCAYTFCRASHAEQTRGAAGCYSSIPVALDHYYRLDLTFTTAHHTCHFLWDYSHTVTSRLVTCRGIYSFCAHRRAEVGPPALRACPRDKSGSAENACRKAYARSIMRMVARFRATAALLSNAVARCAAARAALPARLPAAHPNAPGSQRTHTHYTTAHRTPHTMHCHAWWLAVHIPLGLGQEAGLHLPLCTPPACLHATPAAARTLHDASATLHAARTAMAHAAPAHRRHPHLALASTSMAQAPWRWRKINGGGGMYL